MIESCEHTGHRRMIASAPASAQSPFSLRWVAGNEIKIIVQMGLCPGYSDRQKILPGAEPSPFQNPDWKRISNLRHASYFRRQAPYIGRSSEPKFSTSNSPGIGLTADSPKRAAFRAGIHLQSGCGTAQAPDRLADVATRITKLRAVSGPSATGRGAAIPLTIKR
jgi:hypothetical protein